MLNFRFSHVYVERSVSQYPRTEAIISKLKGSRIVEIRHYKDVFTRPSQDFSLQKKSPKLIIARGRPPFLYRASERCQSFGARHFFYATSVINCPYNCEYCYLQGKFPSGNLVLFVNLEDTFEELNSLLKAHPIQVSISYDTDLLALEGLTHFVRDWLNFCEKKNDLSLEIRTKSVSISSILKREPVSKAVLSWTISPEKVARDYEKGAPRPSERLKAANSLMEKGWNIRLCFDPILYFEDWREQYIGCIKETFKMIDAKGLKDVSLGVFRIGGDYLKRARKANPVSRLLSYPFERAGDTYTYPKALRSEMIKILHGELGKFIPKEKIF